MSKQLVSFSIMQTSIVVACLYFVIMLINGIVLFGFYLFNQGSVRLSVVIIYPIVAWIVTFLSTVVICFIYNKIAKKTGGIEFELKDSTF